MNWDLLWAIPLGAVLGIALAVVMWRVVSWLMTRTAGETQDRLMERLFPGISGKKPREERDGN